jgi:hypothetical protein
MRPHICCFDCNGCRGLHEVRVNLHRRSEGNFDLPLLQTAI